MAGLKPKGIQNETHQTEINRDSTTGWKALVPYVTLVKIPEHQRKPDRNGAYLNPTAAQLIVYTGVAFICGTFFQHLQESIESEAVSMLQFGHIPHIIAHSLQALPHAAAARGRYGRLLHGPLGEKKLRRLELCTVSVDEPFS